MMIQEALKYLVDLGARTPHRETIAGVEYADRGLQVVRPPRAAPLGFRRLRGFADFVLLGNERIVREQTVIHVLSPFEVVYFSTLDEAHRDREVYARVTVDEAAGFQFGEFMSCEDFVIAAMTLVEDREDRPELLQVVGTAGTENVTDARDDGVSQSISVKAGVALQKRKEIQNPFKLAPHRTFVEVEQPESPFILRARQGAPNNPPTFALFECDGGKWQIEAIERIRAWLEGRLTDVGVPVLA